MEQRTEEWFDARAGRITASRMCDVMAFSDGGVYLSGKRKGQTKEVRPLKARTDYIHQLAAERLTNKPRKQVKAWALQWGRDMEPAAVTAYEAETGFIVTPAGFVTHPLYDFIGASPDLTIEEDGGGEIKCPESSEVHLATLVTGLPEEHIEQIQGGLWVTHRKWWDFISYHPDFPPALRLYVQRVYRDEEYIAKLTDACLSLESEVQAIVTQLQQKAA
jgi:hypothetical protein